MNNNNGKRMYNILLPLWLLLFWPSPLWLALIPANYIIDRIILRWSLGDMPDKGLFCRKHTWKICLAGFASDFVGAGILFIIFMAASGSDVDFLHDLAHGVGFYPFSTIWSTLAVGLAVFVSALLIFRIDRGILTRAGLSAEQARHSAIRLAVITAPYLYFFPSGILYDGVL